MNIDYRNSKPIYLQIKDSVRNMIITGAVSEEERLPSVRELARELAINPNTIQRAYRELEQEGYIYSVAGKGYFADRVQEVDRERTNELLQTVREAARELLFLGVTEEELSQLISEVRGGEA